MIPPAQAGPEAKTTAMVKVHNKLSHTDLIIGYPPFSFSVVTSAVVFFAFHDGSGQIVYEPAQTRC
jgi:hypothetical protein